MSRIESCLNKVNQSLRVFIDTVERAEELIVDELRRTTRHRVGELFLANRES